MWFCLAGARNSAPSQKPAKHEGFVAVSKTLAGVGSVRRFCKDAFCVAGAVQETVSSAPSFPLLKEVSENCFVFDVGNLEN